MISTGKLVPYICAWLIVLSAPALAKSAANAAYEPLIEPGYEPDPATDEGGFWYQIAELEEEVQRSPKLVADAELNAYISGITCQLAGGYCEDIRVYIMDTPHFNAAMYPNGMMHVWSGLLLRVDSEAELAAVLSHELAHYFRAHQITQWRKLRRGASAAIFIDMALTGGLATLAVLSDSMSFSRDQETEADLYGLQLMHAAGYLPSEASDLWRHVHQEEEHDKSKEDRSLFFASHPLSEDRIEQLTEAIGEYTAPSNAKAQEKSLVERVTPHYFDLMSQHMVLQDFGRTEYLLKRHAEIGYPSAQVAFFWGELHRLRNNADDIDKAVTYYQQSVAQAGAPAAAFRELGYLLIKQKKMGGIDYLRQYLAAADNPQDRELIEFYLQMDVTQ